MPENLDSLQVILTKNGHNLTNDIKEQEEETNHVSSAGKSEMGVVKNENNRGFSPHSTVLSTPSPPQSGGNRKLKTIELETKRDADENTPTGSSDTLGDTPSAQDFSQLKRYLSSTLKFSFNFSQENGERILGFIINLMAGLITTEEFQRQVEDVIGLPFRSSVYPLFERQVPFWQKEISISAQTSKQTTAQYIKQNVKSLLDCNDKQQDIWEVFQPQVNTTRKRRASTSAVENGGSNDSSLSTPKRPHISLYSDAVRTLSYSSVWIPPKVRLSAESSSENRASTPSYLQRSVPSSNGFTLTKNSNSQSTVSPSLLYDTPSASKFHSHGDEEWNNIHTMLNCILCMVEKTRKALCILQQRSIIHDHSDTTSQWRCRNNGELAYEASELRRQAGELIAQTLKATEDRVSEVKRKAEEAVQDVKRAAMAELQRALAAERARAERLAAEARRQGAEETLLALGRHSQAKEICWNCGRRASETCSGCNIARYCSTFCQHKHWEIHHKICGRVSQLTLTTSTSNGGMEMANKINKMGETSRVTSPLVSNKNSKSPSPIQGSYGGIVN